MCFPHVGIPFAMLLDQQTRNNGDLLMFFSLVFGKVVALNRSGMHTSSRGFEWPIGKTVHDAYAKFGSHDYGLHYLASPTCAPMYNSYDSHLLGVFPAPQVWHPQLELPTPEMLAVPQQQRCYHSTGGTTLCCFTCSGLELDVLTDPALLRDLKRPRSLPGKLNINNLLTSNKVWYRSVVFHGN
jgi:hypothetical protein